MPSIPTGKPKLEGRQKSFAPTAHAYKMVHGGRFYFFIAGIDKNVMDDGRVLNVGTESLNPSFARGKLHRSTHVFCIDGGYRVVGKIKSNMCCVRRRWIDKCCTGIVLCGIALGHTGVANAFVERGCGTFGPNTIGVPQFHPICESVAVRIFETQFLGPFLVMMIEI